MLRFSLKAMVKRLRPAMARTRKRLILREITPTGVLRGNLERLYMRMVRHWWSGATQRLLPAYQQLVAEARQPVPGVVLDAPNDPGGGLSGVMNELDQLADRLVIELTTDLRAWAGLVERWHLRQWTATLTPSGVHLDTLLSAEDVTQTVELTIQQNVALIRSISDEMRARLVGVVYRGFQQRLQARTVAKEISAIAGMSRKRALRIASHQLASLSSELDTARMEQAGLAEFQWAHSGKLHPRLWHKERDGQIFKLRGEIPPGDMPGIPPFCGCKKRAVLSLDF